MSVIDTLTEGIRQRSLAREGEALLDKWERTGLLEGLDDHRRGNMSRLLENQAAQLLKETSTMQAGDVQGFASVAFPIVRRVFGNLLAQDLVSVQPMSLPSGLIFFMDFTFSGDVEAGMPRLAQMRDESLYGGGVVGQQLTGGVNLGGPRGELSFYDLNAGYSSPTGSFAGAAGTLDVLRAGTYGDQESLNMTVNGLGRVFRGDQDLVSGTSTYLIVETENENLTSRGFQSGAASPLVEIVVSGTDGVGGISADAQPIDTPGARDTAGFMVRRLTQWSGSYDGAATGKMLYVFASLDGSVTDTVLEAAITSNNVASGTVFFPIADRFVAAGAPFGAVAGSTLGGGWGLENNPDIPQIDIKVDSVAVTAKTKKLKAKWSPELAQDLNAYHNLDAEVELTSILSEQIALEIDQEILSDLVNGATAATLHWSRLPGKFVNRETGAANGNSLYPDFTGTVSEWYETLLETVNEVSARIHRKTLRGGANFLVCGPEVANILEFTAGFRASAAVDEEGGSWGVKQVGSISRKMDIYVDPYFMRNLLLIGRKGSSFLESGFVYAPYVPLQTTPTIFGTEDFVPRKGVMTRYASQMVRPDMYGLVVIHDLISS
jgi:hypothetical protein